MINEIKMIVGSWGSYNACNERALGSKWLNLDDYADWEEIEEELIKEGFKLDGIDEELFIQDLDNFDASGLNCDYMHPKRFFELIKESDVLNDIHKWDIMEAYLEVRSFSDFEDIVDKYGINWTDDIYLWKGCSWEDYGREYFESCCYELPNGLEDFFDFEAYGRYIGTDFAEEYSDGIIEIR